MIKIDNVNVWILKTNTNGGRIAKECYEKGIVAVGWSLNDYEKDIETYEEYVKIAEEIYGSVNIVKRLATEVKKDDIVWMRDANKGKYYVCKIEENSKWEFSNNKEDKDLDIANRINNVKWEEVGDESQVPGVITCQFNRAGQTLFRIKTGIESALLYSIKTINKKLNDNYYDCEQLTFNKENFFNMLSPDEVEDLIYFYLYDKYGYIIVPSSNKRGTPHYEYVLLDPNNENKKTYVQAKNGNIELDKKDFVELIKDKSDEVYLFTRGNVKGQENINIKQITDEELFNWETDKKGRIIISDTIKFWLEFLANDEIGNDVKGIMFDTNKTYYIEDERRMLNKKEIWSKGNSKRYIYSFNKGDYALYYSRGDGIIAIGKIIDEEPFKIEDGYGLGRKVDILVPEEKYFNNIDEQECISPNEIRQLLNKNFYWASTIKSPFLTEKEVNILINELKNRYQKKHDEK